MAEQSTEGVHGLRATRLGQVSCRSATLPACRSSWRRPGSCTPLIITLAFAPSVQSRAPDIGEGRFVVAALFAVFLCVSVLIHELGHALMALRATATAYAASP